MTDKDKKDVVDLFNQGITELILPVLDEMKSDIKDLKETTEDIQTQLDSIERKFEAQQLRSDEHGKVIDKIKHSSLFA